LAKTEDTFAMLVE